MIGFLGFGNMAQAMAKGFVKSGEKNIIASARNQEKLKKITNDLNIKMAENNEELVEKAEWIIISVKPYQAESVLEPLKEVLKNKKIISIMAGWDYKRMSNFFGEGYNHLTIMPNLPVAIGKGIILCEREHSLTKKETIKAEVLLKKIAFVDWPEEEEYRAASTLSGCGPAFVAMILEALADGAVKYGVSRKRAYELAAKTLEGTGKLQYEEGIHPAEIKDNVCSPGGTTIKGVSALEEYGLRNAMIKGMDEILK